MVQVSCKRNMADDRIDHLAVATTIVLSALNDKSKRKKREK